MTSDSAPVYVGMCAVVKLFHLRFKFPISPFGILCLLVVNCPFRKPSVSSPVVKSRAESFSVHFQCSFFI